jgi:hypothetical protein
MRKPFKLKLACLATLAVTAALATSAQSASASATWHFGSLKETFINDCFSFDVVNGVGEYAGALYDDGVPPKPGDVFYVNVVLNGLDASCVEQTLPDIWYSSGVSTAISPANPLLCYTVNTSTNSETPFTAGCPQSLGAPLTGGVGSIRNPSGASPGMWDTRAPNAWEFRIPLTSTSSGTRVITFPTNVISGSITQSLEPQIMVPVVGPDVGPTPNPNPGPGPNKLTLGGAAKKATLSSGGLVSFALTSSENGTATVAGTISLPKAAKALKLAKRSVTLRAGKATKVALKLSKKNAAAVRKALKRGRKLTAHITVSAKSASGDRATKTLSLKLGR